MTLRARLTAAFLVVVLGPVLLGAGFVAVTVAAVSEGRSHERMDLAVTGVRTATAALCQRLHTAAETAALLGGGKDAGAAQRVVDRQLAGSVQLVDATGRTLYTGGALPPRPWADCSGAANAGAYGAIAARVEMRGSSGQQLGFAYAVEPVDLPLVRRLSTASGAAVTVLPGASAYLSTENRTDKAQVVAAGRQLRGMDEADTDNGRCVRRVAQGPGQPLPLVLSVGREHPQGLYAVLIAVVVMTGLLSVAAAWWLARSTTRPLTELAYAVDRVAGGELGTRVPVRSQDEVGRLAATFNRMAREMQGYVHALTASRDQLRGHLGLLGDTLSSTHDVDRILEVILQSALSATGAQAGVLLLVDAQTGSLVGQCAEGLAEHGPGRAPPEVRDLRVRMGEGLLGEVAGSGAARRGRVDRDGPRLVPSEPRCRTYVAVPFAAPGSSALPGPTGGVGAVQADADGGFEGQPPARGVLALYDRHGFDEFDDADLNTLQTFAGQAAVALDNVRVHEEAQRLSLTDPLTGLSNYRYLKESLRREVERASRFNHRLAVLALDLDRFKEVNDTHGHPAGDAVLSEFARRLRAEIREVDLAFRQGGEEFVVLLPETDTAGGQVAAERLAAALRRTPVIARSGRSPHPARIQVTVSIGIAVYPDHGSTGTAVLEAADDALYQAKADGRDVIRMARPRPAAARGAVADAATVTSNGAPNAAAPPRQSRGG